MRRNQTPDTSWGMQILEKHHPNFRDEFLLEDSDADPWWHEDGPGEEDDEDE